MKIEIFLFLGLALQALAKPTLHFTNGQKQSFKPQALPADPDDFSADDVVNAIEDGQTYLDKLKELCETVEEVADDINLEQVANVAVKSLKIIKKLGFYEENLVGFACEKYLAFPTIRISQNQGFDDFAGADVSIIGMTATSTSCSDIPLACSKFSPFVNVG